MRDHLTPAAQVYALQPWRWRTREAHVTVVAVGYPDRPVQVLHGTDGGRATPGVLKALEGQYVATWNGIFDLAWLLVHAEKSPEFLEAVKGIRWVDAMVLWKWVDNGQLMERGGSWSLASGASRWLKDWPKLERFLALKASEVPVGERDDYWIERCNLDAEATALIAERAYAALTPQQRQSALIDMESLILDAQSWVDGTPLDAARAEEMAGPILYEMYEIEKELGLVDYDFLKHPEIKEFVPTRRYLKDWQKSSILSSPDKMRHLLYNVYGLTATRYSEKTNEPATDKAALTYLADFDDRVLSIMRWRVLNTQWTKFIEGIRKCTEYNGEPMDHSQPRIFSTYTGRMTYGTKSGQSGEAAKAKIGIAKHQWPRNKALRGLLLAEMKYSA